VLAQNYSRPECHGIRISICSVYELFDAEEKTFTRQDKAFPHSRQLVCKLYRGPKENDAGECFAARDAGHRVHSACLLVLRPEASLLPDKWRRSGPP